MLPGWQDSDGVSAARESRFCRGHLELQGEYHVYLSHKSDSAQDLARMFKLLLEASPRLGDAVQLRLFRRSGALLFGKLCAGSFLPARCGRGRSRPQGTLPPNAF